jgi:tRNA(Ile)-lysidine synthase
MDSLVDRVRATVDRERLLPAGSTVVAGVSGGPDSQALLHVLAELAKERDLRVYAAHLDHGLRPDSAEDAAFVAGECRRAGVPLVSERVDWTARGGPPRTNVEAVARDVRYRFLSRVAGDLGAVPAVGHHADDRVETFLVQLLRGAGPRGLSRPRFRREDGLIRPLLEVRREEIVAFLAERDLPWREDPTNRDGSNLRSRLRAEVVPLLERESPALARLVGRTADLLADLDALAERLAADAARDLTVREGPGELVLDGPRARTYDAFVRTTLLRLGIGRVGGDPSAVGREALDAVSRAWEDGRVEVVELPGGITVVPEGPHLRLAGASPPLLETREIPVPARVSLPGGSAHLTVEEAAPPADPRSVSGPRTAWLDADRVQGPLVVRSRRPGDRYRPVGLAGSARLQDLLVDRKVPRPWRDTLPVLADDAGIVWIPGFRVDRRPRITEATSRALRLEVTGSAPWLGGLE